jgi:hypothetical protein
VENLNPLPELPEIEALGQTYAARIRRYIGIQPPGHDHGIEIDLVPGRVLSVRSPLATWPEWFLVPCLCGDLLAKAERIRPPCPPTRKQKGWPDRAGA